MNRFSKFALVASICAVGHTAQAQTVNVTSDITVSTTWTNDNTYCVRNPIFVRNGATLTIEAGTVIASEAFGGGPGGGVAVTRGSQIQCLGTEENPVIWTSKDDVATWAVDGTHPTGRNPKTGTSRLAANEWGNLTIMGRAFISEDVTVIPTNSPTCNPGNVANMEGLIAAFPGDPNVQYGGGNDEDDSGTIQFTSFRYAGRVVGLNNELNGLSLGGIGRGTDIHHVEIFNNVDDGIEIWGGTVNLNFISIWNVGDDSLDIDQGWRGRAQHGLIVQGASIDASQGSGVGDNCIEIDGAENSDQQPVTTTSIYNFTVIGQPVAGDGGTAWRDNARVQYTKCIFMDLGERLVRFDNLDGDGAQGYGFNGTLSWANTWNTAFNGAPAHPNDCPPGVYTAQCDGNLAVIRDSVFFRNLSSDAYTEATARGVFNAGNGNVLIPGFAVVDEPIQRIERGGPVQLGGQTILPVTNLDPRAANEATTATNVACDSFFLATDYRGGFSADRNWLARWSAADAFGLMSDTGQEPTAYCADANGNSVSPSGAVLTCVSGYGTSEAVFNVYNTPNQPGILFAGPGQLDLPFGCGRRCIGGQIARGNANNPQNNQVLGAVFDMTIISNLNNIQYWYRDPANVGNCGATFNLSNALTNL